MSSRPCDHAHEPAGERTEGGKVEWRGRGIGVRRGGECGRAEDHTAAGQDGLRPGECTAQEQRLKVDSEHSNSM